MADLSHTFHQLLVEIREIENNNGITKIFIYHNLCGKFDSLAEFQVKIFQNLSIEEGSVMNRSYFCILTAIEFFHNLQLTASAV